MDNEELLSGTMLILRNKGAKDISAEIQPNPRNYLNTLYCSYYIGGSKKCFAVVVGYYTNDEVYREIVEIVA